jgi:glycerophosphoryl diester phosphodiesterase
VRELGANDVRFDIETKVFPDRPEQTLPPDEFVASLLAVIRGAGMTARVTIQSFDWRTLQIVQRLEPDIRTVYLTTQGRNGGNVADPRWTGGLKLADYPSVAHMVKAAGGSVWSPNFNDVDEAAVKNAQRLGLQVIPWTVNAVGDLRRLLDWGVDGIITDYPDRLRELMRERGLALPRRSVGASRRASAFRVRVRLHSMTVDARSRIDLGIDRPSALAVLSLITSASLDGRCTGSSAGLAPWRIRSTYQAARA